MTEQISLIDVGPIEGEFSFYLAKPGAYELQGGPGAGKSTVLSGLDLLAGHKVELTIHDGCTKGRVEGFGRSVSIGKTKRATGELDVDVLPERFNLSDLIEPQGKTPSTRDSNRIKAIASLTDTKVAPSDFYEIAGGEEAYKELAVEVTDDPVLMTSRVKSALDKRGKDLERMASEKRGEQKAELEKTEGVDLEAECRSNVLSEAQEKAAAALQEIQDRASRCSRASDDRRDAQQKIDAAKANYTGPTANEASESMNECLTAHGSAVADRDNLIEQLRQAEERVKETETACDVAKERWETAYQHEDAIADWESTIKADAEAAPTSDEIHAAELALDKSRDASSDGQRIRDAKAAQERSELRRKEAELLERQSSSFRGAAAQAFDVLRDAIKTEHIKIEVDADGNPRLKCECPQRGRLTFFDEVDGLSSAQRIMAAIQELLLKLPAAKAARLFTVNQTDWQHLPPSDKQMLAEYAEANGVFLVGAVVDEGPLRVARINGSV